MDKLTNNTTKENNPVQVIVPVSWCSLCPFGRVDGPVWDQYLKEDVSDVYCRKLEKKVYGDLNWHECASQSMDPNQIRDHIHGIDHPPMNCPFRGKESKNRC